MNLKALLAFALVALVGTTNAETAAQNTGAVTRELQVVDVSSKLLNAINAKRAAKGLKAVCINKKLAKAAQALADDLAKKDRVSTTGSDGSTPTARYKAQSLKTSQSAEMVAAGQTTVDAVVATWLSATGAYLYSDLKYIGPGYKYDDSKQYKHYWVLDMANADGEVCAQ